jgi:hypothetical protein
MWVFKYLVCLISKHLFVGSQYKYCLRCGKLELEQEPQPIHVHADN